MPKKLSFIKKKSKFKSDKQKLIDRINSCKSKKELDGWKRTFAYYDVLKDDQDWDYDFFFNLIEFKLRRMRDYFWSHNIVENEKQYGDICDKLINILNAGYKTNIIVDKDLHNYVNTKNKERFLNKHELNFIEKCPQYYKATIRQAKAEALFWKYLYHRIELLWD